MNIKERIEYILVVTGEFAREKKLSMREAFRYIKEHRGLDILDAGYDIEHTFSIEDAVLDVTRYCQRHGGTIA